MKITADDLNEFLKVVDLDNTERTREGKLLDPQQRAILARLDLAMVKRAMTISDWRLELLRDMRPLYGQLTEIAAARGLGHCWRPSDLLPGAGKEVADTIHLIASLEASYRAMGRVNVAPPEPAVLP